MLFIRRTVEDNEMWIKITKTPYPICTDNIQKTEELLDIDNPTLDIYDNLCKKVENLHLYHLQNNLIKLIDKLESKLIFVENYDDILDEINNNKKYYANLYDLDTV